MENSIAKGIKITAKCGNPAPTLSNITLWCKERHYQFSPEEVVEQRTKNLRSAGNNVFDGPPHEFVLHFGFILAHLNYVLELIHANMPPKRGSATGANKRGRSSARGRGRGGKEHDRVLSDITEESVTQVQTATAPANSQHASQLRGSKKHTFQDIATDQAPPRTMLTRHEARDQAAKRMKLRSDDASIEVETAEHSQSGIKEQAQKTRAQAAKRKNLRSDDALVAVETAAPSQSALKEHAQEGSQLDNDYGVLPDADAEPASDYIPSLNLLFFVQLANLDIDADTESITLDLINLTLAEGNWHTGLSGVVQPVACFLVASLLTRKQNLVEDVAASVEMFGLEYEQMVEGYKLLWEWRENMRPVVGVFGERLDELPDPALLLGQVEQEGTVHCVSHDIADIDERPEPERVGETLEI